MSIDDTGANPPGNNVPQPNEDELTREAISKVIKFFKNAVLEVEEEYLGTDDYIRDIELERTNIRCITTSILTICGFLLPILFGIFYFIVKDSNNLHVNIHWLVIIVLIISILLLFVAIYYSVKGIRAPEAPAQFITKFDKREYIRKRRECERGSSENSIKALAASVVLVLLTFIGIYICIATTPTPIPINETINATSIVINETINTTTIVITHS